MLHFLEAQPIGEVSDDRIPLDATIREAMDVVRIPATDKLCDKGSTGSRLATVGLKSAPLMQKQRRIMSRTWFLGRGC
jgi:hypothetical protein